MSAVKTGILILITMAAALLLAPAQVWAAEASSFKSYKEWKSEKVQEAVVRLDAVKGRLGRRSMDPNLQKTTGTEGRDPETKRLENEIHSDELSVESAKELTVSDYFAGYLIKVQNKRAAFKEAAGKFTAEEVAELMSAYADSVFGTDLGTLPPSALRVGADAVK